MTRSVFRYDPELGCSVNKATGETMNDPHDEWKPAAPRVFGDYDDYASPIDGNVVSGRRARRYDMEKNGCVDGNDTSSGRKMLKNKRFVEKHGLQAVSEI